MPPLPVRCYRPACLTSIWHRYAISTQPMSGCGQVTSLGSGREPGIAITEIGQRDGKWLIRGFRDPLAVDPQVVLRKSSIDPARVLAHWEAYQSLQPPFVLKRVQAAFAPPPTVIFALEGDRIVATGSAPLTWIQRARASNRMVPAGAP